MEIAQLHCEDEHLKFSNYVESLVRAQLVSVGKLPSDEIACALRYARELIAARGVEVVKAKLDELTHEAALGAGMGDP